MEYCENSNKLDIHSTCRTCLASLNELNTHYKIFTTIDLIEKYIVCTSLPIEQDDGLPTNLCEPCCTRIHKFYDFRQMCIASRESFLDLKNSDEKFADQQLDIKEEQSDSLMAIESHNGDKDNFTSYEQFTILELDIKDEPNDVFMFNEVKDENPVDNTELTNDEDEPSNNMLARNENNEECNDFTNDDNVVIPTELLSTVVKDECSEDNEPIEKYQSTSMAPFSLKCKTCHRKLNSAEEIEIHKRIHRAHKPYACTQCDKSFARPGRLKEHIRADHEKHLGEKCTHPDCDKAFKTKQSLRQHIREHHNYPDGEQGKQRFVCEDCGMVLKGISTLKNHRFLHTGQQRPHACTECNKRFMTQWKLKDHMNRHAGIKNFECPHCEVRKTSRSELKSHIKSHLKPN